MVGSTSEHTQLSGRLRAGSMVLFQATQLPLKICLCTLPLLLLSIAVVKSRFAEITKAKTYHKYFTNTEMVVQTTRT